jgi:hypothetical protein
MEVGGHGGGGHFGGGCPGRGHFGGGLGGAHVAGDHGFRHYGERWAAGYAGYSGLYGSCYPHGGLSVLQLQLAAMS